jgi:hypothetical protein
MAALCHFMSRLKLFVFVLSRHAQHTEVLWRLFVQFTRIMAVLCSICPRYGFFASKICPSAHFSPGYEHFSSRFPKKRRTGIFG